ncbi:MAG: hypothetical protein QM676_02860 [Novosphingobium sp.]
MRLAVGLALALAAATASAQPSGPGGPGRGPRQSYADPSAVIAADLALSRIAREKGQWQALRKAAAPGAVLIAPRAVDAATWLKRQPEPVTPQRWEPRTVWMSCDGGYAVSHGVWTRGGSSGEYVAVWERQDKGDWKWLLREEGPAHETGEKPDMIAGKVAECYGLTRRSRPPEDAPPLVPANGASYDRSLRWSVAVAADCSRTITVQTWDGKALVPAFTARREPPGSGCD